MRPFKSRSVLSRFFLATHSHSSRQPTPRGFGDVREKGPWISSRLDFACEGAVQAPSSSVKYESDQKVDCSAELSSVLVSEEHRRKHRLSVWREEVESPLVFTRLRRFIECVKTSAVLITTSSPRVKDL